MSWENVNLTIFGIPQATVTDFSWCDDPTTGRYGGNDKISVEWKFADSCEQENNTYAVGDGTGYGLHTDTPTEQIYVNDYYDYNMLLNGQPQSTPWGFHVPKSHTIGGYNQRLAFIAVINEETQKGIFVFLVQKGGTLSNWYFAISLSNQSGDPANPVAGGTRVCYDFLKGTMPPTQVVGKGGGATHIAKRTGTLAAIGASNISDILLVSGGGGGGLVYSGTAYDGKDAGGISGSGDNSANQSTGYGFGQGESGSNVPGGGGGLYGGYKGE